ncbi:hypothetical protein [Streptomyces sp. NPDC056723]|uniref:hypothetical protein n=1 Tax=unclassified Streptomyces TaxID=2593676 RepID=UPI00369ABE6D
MSGPTPEDLEHLPSLDYALPKVAVTRPGGITLDVELYGAAMVTLQSAGRPTIPLGAFTRLLGAAGFPRRFWKSNGGRVHYYKGLDLLDDAPANPRRTTLPDAA